MSPSSRASNLAQLNESLAQLNSELLMTLKERRALCLKLQEFKDQEGRFTQYDPQSERDVFILHLSELKKLSIKELLVFSLIVEDQAQAFLPGSYPSWSHGIHLIPATERGLAQMINPFLLKLTHPDLFGKLKLSNEFAFLRDF